MPWMNSKIHSHDIRFSGQAVLSQSPGRVFFIRLTSVHDCGITENTVRLVDEEQRSGKLKMKIFALLSDSVSYYDRWVKKGPYITDRLHVGGFKLYADGALGSREPA